MVRYQCSERFKKRAWILHRQAVATHELKDCTKLAVHVSVLCKCVQEAQDKQERKSEATDDLSELEYERVSTMYIARDLLEGMALVSG